MRNPLHTPFAVIFQNEALLNSKRVAPYAMAIFFSSNAVLWTSAAIHFGWAINSDFYIARNYGGFAFGILGLPLFAALIMGDPVIRDFRTGIDPLIFSKPISRAQYLLGKFFGSFLVLICCQAAFGLTMLLLQVFHTPRMLVLPFRVFPYFKYFFLLVVIPYLLFAAVYFTLGTLTRNAKLVYGLAVSYYPLYIAWQVVILKRLSPRWHIVLDPLLFNVGPARPFERSVDYVNDFVVSYTPGMIANRLVVILAAAVCLTVVYLRFTIAERPRNAEKFSTLNLSTAGERLYYDAESLETTRDDEFEAGFAREKVILPDVNVAGKGVGTNVKKLVAALGVEFRLLRAEKSLVVLMPLAVFISTLEIAFWNVTPDPTYSAGYAGNTARALMIFLLGISIFYTGEAMHRDRDLKIEPTLWSQPVPNYVLLLPKFLSILMLTIGLVVLVGVITITLQAAKGNGPFELSAYIRIYSLIVIPNAIFMAAAALALTVFLRDRYLTYAAAIGAAAGLFYLYSQGHKHWLYNPLLYQLWDYQSLIGGPNHSLILQHRIYVLILALLFLVLAHLGYQRNSKTAWR